jgi:hypothetical protein
LPPRDPEMAADAFWLFCAWQNPEAKKKRI